MSQRLIGRHLSTPVHKVLVHILPAILQKLLFTSLVMKVPVLQKSQNYTGSFFLS